MPFLLAGALLTTQFGPQGPIQLPKGGTVANSVKLNLPASKRPRIAMFPLFFGCDLDSVLKTRAQEGFLAGITPLEKNTKFWQFVGTKSLFEKLKGVTQQDPGGQWIDSQAVAAAKALKVDYYGAISIRQYAYMVEGKGRGCMVLGALCLRDAATNKAAGELLLIGTATSKNPSTPQPTIRDAVYDMVAVRLADPKQTSIEIVR